jgi:hypothetical protein
MSMRTFWMERTGDVALGVRRWRRGGPSLGNCDRLGYHAALVYTDIGPARYSPDGMLAEPADDPPRDDPRWPTMCGHGCGYRFVDEDPWQPWQEELWQREDGSRQPHVLHAAAPEFATTAPPGATWDGWWLPDTYRGADGIALCVRCPGGLDWYVDGAATGGSRWTRTGDPKSANVTAAPSISIGFPGAGDHYHGFLRAGELDDHIG